MNNIATKERGGCKVTGTGPNATTHELFVETFFGGTSFVEGSPICPKYACPRKMQPPVSQPAFYLTSLRRFLPIPPL